MTSRRPFLLLRISFPGRPIFIQLPPGGLTAEDLSRSAGVSVVLAKERMLSAERAGVAVRDDSVEGLRFYTNRFLNSEE